MKSLSDTFRKTMPKLLGKSGGQMGWGDLRLLLEQWEEIIGADYAKTTTPVGIKFPITGPDRQTERREGRLTIAAPAALRTEIQHNAVMIMERINRTFGYTAIAKLQLVPAALAQIPVEIPPARPVKLDPALMDGIDDPELCEKLASLAANLGVKG